jgi:hypothetical protein
MVIGGASTPISCPPTNGTISSGVVDVVIVSVDDVILVDNCVVVVSVVVTISVTVLVTVIAGSVVVTIEVLVLVIIDVAVSVPGSGVHAPRTSNAIMDKVTIIIRLLPILSSPFYFILY